MMTTDESSERDYFQNYFDFNVSIRDVVAGSTKMKGKAGRSVGLSAYARVRVVSSRSRNLLHWFTTVVEDSRRFCV